MVFQKHHAARLVAGLSVCLAVFASVSLSARAEPVSVGTKRFSNVPTLYLSTPMTVPVGGQISAGASGYVAPVNVFTIPSTTVNDTYKVELDVVRHALSTGVNGTAVAYGYGVYKSVGILKPKVVVGSGSYSEPENLYFWYGCGSNYDKQVASSPTAIPKGTEGVASRVHVSFSVRGLDGATPVWFWLSGSASSATVPTFAFGRSTATVAIASTDTILHAYPSYADLAGSPNLVSYVDFADISYERVNTSDPILEELEKQTGLQQEANDLQKEQNETSKGIFGAIKDFFGGFFSNLGNTVMGWIVPTSEQLTDFLNEVNGWFSARLGFIWYPFSLAIDMVAALAGGSADQIFHVPALSLDIMGQTYSIWGDIDVDLDAFGIFTYVRFFTSALLVAGIVRMAIDKWDEWIGGHSK